MKNYNVSLHLPPESAVQEARVCSACKGADNLIISSFGGGTEQSPPPEPRTATIISTTAGIQTTAKSVIDTGVVEYRH